MKIYVLTRNECGEGGTALSAHVTIEGAKEAGEAECPRLGWTGVSWEQRNNASRRPVVGKDGVKRMEDRAATRVWWVGNPIPGDGLGDYLMVEEFEVQA